jgi:1,2-phenylacetyl-CoA epoxidase catalytic subunit
LETLKSDTQTGKIPRVKIKELRNALKEGEQSSEYFMKSNLIYDLALIRPFLFDAIEIMDTYISLD